MALTETEIKAISPHPTRHRWVGDGDGLYLRVAPSDRRTWVWRTKRAGKTHYFTIGKWPELSVRQARAALLKRTGRATPPNAMTVRDALEEWFADQIEPRYRVTKNTRVYVNRAVAEFGSRRLQELTRAEIARFVRGYAKEAPVGANRCLSTIKLALGWAVEIGYLEHSPAEGLTNRVAGGEEQSRRRVLSDAEIRELWRMESPNAHLLRALLLTGCRISELQKASRAHLLDDWLFIPAENSKNARAHRVYLVAEARAQFNGADPLLFRTVSPTAVQAWVRRAQMNVEGDGSPREPWASIRPKDPETGRPAEAWTPHDLRRTFSTRLGDLGVAPHVIERLLNHVQEGVAGVYNRSELGAERITATRLWAAELARIVGV